MAHPRPSHEATAGRSGRREHAPARRAWLLLGAGGVAVLLVAATALAWSESSAPAHTWMIASPDGAVTATVDAHASAYTLTVQRRGRRVLETPLGRADAR